MIPEKFYQKFFERLMKNSKLENLIAEYNYLWSLLRSMNTIEDDEEIKINFKEIQAWKDEKKKLKQKIDRYKKNIMNIILETLFNLVVEAYEEKLYG